MKYRLAKIVIKFMKAITVNYTPTPRPATLHSCKTTSISTTRHHLLSTAKTKQCFVADVSTQGKLGFIFRPNAFGCLFNTHKGYNE